MCLEVIIMDYDKKSFTIPSINNNTYYIDTNGIVTNELNKTMTFSTHHQGYKLFRRINKQTNQGVTLKVHKLVANAFIPNPDNKPQINHKDGNKANNHISNLEWCTQLENNRHAHQLHGNFTSHKGITHPMVKYSEEQIKFACELFELGYSASEVSYYTNISISQTESIRARKSWTHISKDYDWVKGNTYGR
jgi:subtilase family serine protease